MKDKKGIFYILASLVYMAIAVYSINMDSLFLGFAWGLVSIANLVEGVYLVRKRKQQSNNTRAAEHELYLCECAQILAAGLSYA